MLNPSHNQQGIGVVPIIVATSLLMLPIIIATLTISKEIRSRAASGQGRRLVLPCPSDAGNEATDSAKNDPCKRQSD